MQHKQMRARDYPKIHHPDPSGFWHLVRTGEMLPAVGDRILYVHDIRGTSQELHRNMMVRIANGDPYKCSGLKEKLEAGQKIYEHEVMLAELLKLPVNEYKPETRIGVVETVEYDTVLREWWITIQRERGWPALNVDPDHIIYWAPFPTPPDTYTVRPDDFEQIGFDAQRGREWRIKEYLDSRAARRKQ